MKVRDEDEKRCISPLDECEVNAQGWHLTNKASHVS